MVSRSRKSDSPDEVSRFACHNYLRFEQGFETAKQKLGPIVSTHTLAQGWHGFRPIV